MGLRAGNTDRLQSVFFIKRIGDAAALDRLPIDRLIGEFDRLGASGVLAGTEEGRATEGRTARLTAGRAGVGAAMAAASGSRGGIAAVTQPSSVAASGAMPGDAGNTP